jgi:hypothetical protein
VPLCSETMRLVEQWSELERHLPESWDEARLVLVVENGDPDRAAALLGPANPGRRRDAIVFDVRRGGGGASPDGVRRLLARLDRERFAARLELTGSTEAGPRAAVVHETLVDAWDRELAKLPADWSDLLAEVEFRSSSQLDRAALLLSPVNPGRPPDEATALVLRFRCARRFGYGASAAMARRCLARCDEESIRGAPRLLWALSDTHPVATQGPVWYVGGRAS